MADVFTLSDGNQFVASKRIIPENSPFGAFRTAEEIVAWGAEKFGMLQQIKRAEEERLKTNELYYAGFHYIEAWRNQQEAITNYCRSTVETIFPILTQTRPRPEPVPRNYMDATRVRRLKEYATYKMDSSGFDSLLRKCVRDLLKFGWCVPRLAWDNRGRSIGKYVSPFDFYPDTAWEESEMEMFALAYPVPTRRLRGLFPDVANRIFSDNIASPGYEVFEQPYIERAGLGFGSPLIIGSTMRSASFEDGTPSTTTGQYGIDTGHTQSLGHTTFVIQLFVRDYTTMTVKYVGDKHFDHPDGPFKIPFDIQRQEPCCPSGWRMVPFTAGGVLLEWPQPVDACLGGIPLVMGRNYECGGRIYAIGELDDVIPIQRDVNRSDMLIARALELQGNPPVIVDDNSLLPGQVDKATVEGGEILKKRRGTQIAYLQPQGLAESHFVRRAARRQDIQIVSGTPDSLQGQRPVGVEAAAAIRQLTESASSRARAKGPAILEFAAILLTKMIYADIQKSEDVIHFVASDGSKMWIDPADFKPSDFYIRWAQGTGDAQSAQDREDRNLQYYQLGLIDGRQVLEDADYPDRMAISNRMALQQAQMAMAQAQAAKQNGGSNGGPPK